ncbi:MAG: hypothetical protein OHK0029_35670 [Armatimonadaceae bacterium]
MRNGNIPGWLRRSQEIRQDMTSRNFDLAINCHPDKWWTAILCAAPLRVGLYPSEQLPWSRQLYTHAINRPPDIHNTDHYLMATEAVGIPAAGKQMTVGETPEEAPFVTGFRQKHGLRDGKPVVILAPFTTAENKCWEPERFAQTADALREQRDAEFVLTMGPRDADAARRIASQAQTPIHLAEGTTLREYVALLRHADLVISGDSSPLHLAAAVGTPFITIFGPTSEREIAPQEGFGKILRHPLPCAPCNSTRCHNPVFRACMKAVPVEEVVRAAVPILTKAGSQVDVTQVAGDR